jgi:hypothetical protein
MDVHVHLSRTTDLYTLPPYFSNLGSTIHPTFSITLYTTLYTKRTLEVYSVIIS